MILPLTPPLSLSRHTSRKHAILLSAWQQARTMPPLRWPEPESVQWVQRPDRTPVEPDWAPPATPIISTPAPSVDDVPEAPPDPQAAASITPADGSTLAERARREAGAIDEVLRKDNKAIIVALAPSRWWEAPKVVELVNDGGDGARRVRVLTALGIYCITERSPVTSIDMIERHGKLRITHCGHAHEQPADLQEWRTARE